MRGVDASTADLDAGETKVAIQVTFNAYVDEVTHGELLEDVLDETLTRAQKVVADTTLDAVLTELQLGTKTQVTEDNVTESAPAPGTKVTYSATTTSAGMIPLVRDLVTTKAGFDSSVTGADADTTPAPTGATGYADDVATTTKVQEDKNAASQVRIGRSSSVKAPQ